MWGFILIVAKKSIQLSTNRETEGRPESLCKIVEQMDDGIVIENNRASNLTSGDSQVQGKSIFKLLMDILFKLLGWIYISRPIIGGMCVKKNLDMTSDSTQRSNTHKKQNISCPPKGDPLHPCCQRLQHLEKAVTELLNKPTEIPPEKEHILLDSLDRIKSIEYDLQKTKKALFATASQQVELAESLELLKDESFKKGTPSCWPRTKLSSPRAN